MPQRPFCHPGLPAIQKCTFYGQHSAASMLRHKRELGCIISKSLQQQASCTWRGHATYACHGRGVPKAIQG